MKKRYQICTKTIMDTSDPDIFFDENGISNHYHTVKTLEKSYPHFLSKKQKKKELLNQVQRIKLEGKNNKYDCLIGVSGGVDSTYVAYLVKDLGLTPLAFHLDNGWNSELAVKNIENTLNNFGIDLHTEVLDWMEFKDLQLSFLKASVPDLEIPTDHAISSSMYRVAKKYGIKNVITGINFSTESIAVSKWSTGHGDWRYISQIQKKFGTVPLKSYPHKGFFRGLYYHVLNKGIKTLDILNFIDFNKEDALKELEEKIGYIRYKYKHGESTYTVFVQNLVLPDKFGYDKRRMHLSSLISSGQLTREKAVKDMKEPLFSTDIEKEELKNYVADKLGITEDELHDLLELKNKHYVDYPSMKTTFMYKIIYTMYHKFKEIGKEKK